ncbi:uncharacterized protein M421DRAFT_419651 [Didymella exigua CBS 183.55]|uniref:Rhodopsin domain-containing protein n=1 Tax=Didymella exigua CBS 183.55 TaxID=1150837 RepID=A0A6A5RR04_9PLEO|nr:uncharacterized protein M421DRAFT_419651 [Didymella exigua CBS 183.55]KAF1929883.1 hypothetical protein M421DRAFT_419651 [Didymella exigua CBS 183.55]
MGVIHRVVRQNDGSQEFPPDFLAETRQPEMIIGNIAVQLIGSLFYFARAYSRAAITKAWRAEDYVLTLAWVFCTGYSVCQYGQIDNGFGRHVIATIMENPQALVTSQKYAYAAQIILSPALALSKMSICLTYLRIFYVDKHSRYMMQALLVLLVLLTFPFMFANAFQCRPIEVYWTEGRPAGKCSRDLSRFFLTGSLNIFADVALIGIVLPRILELQLHKRQKWALTGIVLLGSLSVVAGIVRTVRLGTLFLMPDFEPSWDSYDVSIWTSTEIYVSLFCASAPGVKPVVVKILPKILGSSFSRGRTRATGGTRQGGTVIELGLGSKWKRTTIGSTRTHNSRLSEAALATADGSYTEVGSDVDARSLAERSDKPTSDGGSSLGGHVRKTSEITIHTRVM